MTNMRQCNYVMLTHPLFMFLNQETLSILLLVATHVLSIGIYRSKQQQSIYLTLSTVRQSSKAFIMLVYVSFQSSWHWKLFDAVLVFLFTFQTTTYHK